MGKLGSEAVCSALEELGIEVLFGLPGTQSLAFFEGLRRSNIRTVLAGSEVAAAFAAGGYYRSSGRLAALSTIPGPGLIYALNGIAEARHDSAAMLVLVVRSTSHQERAFRLQDFDLPALSEQVVKKSFRIQKVGDAAPILSEAVATALSDEPGPVLVEMDSSMLVEHAGTGEVAPVPSPDPPRENEVAEVVARLEKSRRPILFCGQGAFPAADLIREMSEKLRVPVITTGSGRGLISENTPLSIPCDFSSGSFEQVNALLAEADLIITIGAKLGHNGSAGFNLILPEDKMIRVDTSAATLEGNYPSSLEIRADSKVFMVELKEALAASDLANSDWDPNDLGDWRSKTAADMQGKLPHIPLVSGAEQSTVADVVQALRRVAPEDAILATDSGYHQVIARTFWRSLAPRGMLVPSDLQSMGFGIPAAIGAAVANPDRRVVAVIGDGGLIMSGMELLTAVRENIPLSVLLVNDSSLGQIRMEQYRAYGNDHATELLSPNTEAWCLSLGIKYIRLEDGIDDILSTALNQPGVTLVEAVCTESEELKKLRRKGDLNNRIKRLVGSGLIAKLKKLLGR